MERGSRARGHISRQQPHGLTSPCVECAKMIFSFVVEALKISFFRIFFVCQSIVHLTRQHANTVHARSSSSDAKQNSGRRPVIYPSLILDVSKLPSSIHSWSGYTYPLDHVRLWTRIKKIFPAIYGDTRCFNSTVSKTVENWGLHRVFLLWILVCAHQNLHHSNHSW